MKFLALTLIMCASYVLAQQAAPITPPPVPEVEKIPIPKDDQDEAYKKALSIQSAQLIVGRIKEQNEASLKDANSKVDVAAKEWAKYGDDLKTKLKMPKECGLSFNEAWMPELVCPKGAVPKSPGEANK